jgi:hypothetical protein
MKIIQKEEHNKKGESIMKKKTIIIITALLLSIMLFTANGFADIPAPPVNQLLGMPDTVMNFLVEAECRACHQDGTVDAQGNEINPNSIPDRHHLLYGLEIVKGKCRNSGDECVSDADCTGTNETCTGQSAASDPYANGDFYNCFSCHEGETHVIDGTTNFLVERDCLVCHAQVGGEASVHHLTGTAQGTDSNLGDPLKGDCTPCHGTIVDDYGDDAIIPTYSPSLVTPTVNKGTALEKNSEGYSAGSCNFCHSSGTGSDAPGQEESGVEVFRNGTLHHTAGVHWDRYREFVNGGCEFCHGNPLTTDGDALMLRNCQQCHGFESLHNIQADSPNPDNIGTIVVGGEDYGYGHIGIDDPVRGGTCSVNGEVCYSDADCPTVIEPGLCDIDGTTPCSVDADCPLIVTPGTCIEYAPGNHWCDDDSTNCNANGDADCPPLGSAPSTCTPGEVTPTTCDLIGAGSDCWGCHGFDFNTASAPGTGPVTPALSDSTKEVIIAGTDTTITLNGESLTNTSGTTEFVSTFILTSRDGVTVPLTTIGIDAFSSTIVIPGTTAQGNYLLTAIKDDGAARSNPLPISIKPPVIIESQTIEASCGDCSGVLVITGSGFGVRPPAGTEIYINVMQNNVPLNIIAWWDTMIVATGAVCDGSEITVNNLFDSATK